jgi:hypothetical protein
LTTKGRKDHPEHKDHHKEVSLLLQWHMQFFIANNDPCIWEHKDHSKEVPVTPVFRRKSNASHTCARFINSHI